MKSLHLHCKDLALRKWCGHARTGLLRRASAMLRRSLSCIAKLPPACQCTKHGNCLATQLSLVQPCNRVFKEASWRRNLAHFRMSAVKVRAACCWPLPKRCGFLLTIFPRKLKQHVQRYLIARARSPFANPKGRQQWSAPIADLHAGNLQNFAKGAKGQPSTPRGERG